MATANPLPPGRNGLPLLGETLAFVNNPFAFIHQRRARFGKVVKTMFPLSPDRPAASGLWVLAPLRRREEIARR